MKNYKQQIKEYKEEIEEKYVRAEAENKTVKACQNILSESVLSKQSHRTCLLYTSQKRKSGRGRDDSRPYPFTDLFDLRAYASAVYILSFDGKRLPDVKG